MRVAGASFRPEVLREARRRAGLTQVDLAKRAGIRDSGRIGIWERGQDQPSPASIPRLAEALGLAPADLYDPLGGAVTFEVLRRSEGLSLTALGERTGLGYKRVRRIEKGLQVLTNDDVDHLSAALGVTKTRICQAAESAAATRKPSARGGP